MKRLCVKCGEKAVTVARAKDSFCRSVLRLTMYIMDFICPTRECFRAYFTHRFRATFGRAKIVRQGEKVTYVPCPVLNYSCVPQSIKVLVAVSGGVSSRVLQQLVEEVCD